MERWCLRLWLIVFWLLVSGIVEVTLRQSTLSVIPGLTRDPDDLTAGEGFSGPQTGARWIPGQARDDGGGESVPRVKVGMCGFRCGVSRKIALRGKDACGSWPLYREQEFPSSSLCVSLSRRPEGSQTLPRLC